MSPTKQQKILNPWFYDLALQTLNIELTKAKIDLKKFLEMKERPGGIPIVGSYFEGKIERGLEGKIELARQEYELMERAKPVLIGAATLDSLIRATPDSYEHIAKQQVPFNELFFEFLSPFPMDIPFESEKRNARGIHCFVLPPGFSRFNIGNSSDKTYGIHVYFQEAFNKIHSLVLETNPVVQSTFYCAFEGNAFCVDMKRRTCTYQSAEAVEKLIGDSFNPLGFVKRLLIKKQRDLAQTFLLDKMEKSYVLPQLANLFTNLVNYINAHNVTFVQKSRNLIVIQKKEKQKKKKVEIQKPYYLIIVKDEVKDSGNYIPYEQRKLKCRFYVRGHCRNFRDDSGRIYLTSWIPPHIRGPIDAPWKHHRYQVLADRLTREKEMMENL